jgi:Tol biopolymer transport system component
MPLVLDIGFNSPAFVTPDGKWALYQDKDASGKLGIFRVSINGGTPQHLGDPPDNQYFEDWFFSPDSRQVLIVGAGAADLWRLENFVPPSRK